MEGVGFGRVEEIVHRGCDAWAMGWQSQAKTAIGWGEVQEVLNTLYLRQYG